MRNVEVMMADDFLASVADRLKIQQLVRLLNQSQVNHLYDHASIL